LCRPGQRGYDGSKVLLRGAEWSRAEHWIGHWIRRGDKLGEQSRTVWNIAEVEQCRGSTVV
jgi:hypothetical protein